MLIVVDVADGFSVGLLRVATCPGPRLTTWYSVYKSHTIPDILYGVVRRHSYLLSKVSQVLRNQQVRNHPKNDFCFTCRRTEFSSCRRHISRGRVRSVYPVLVDLPALLLCPQTAVQSQQVFWQTPSVKCHCTPYPSPSLPCPRPKTKVLQRAEAMLALVLPSGFPDSVHHPYRAYAGWQFTGMVAAAAAGVMSTQALVSCDRRFFFGVLVSSLLMLLLPPPLDEKKTPPWGRTSSKMYEIIWLVIF